MQIKVFDISYSDSTEELEKINKFLRGNKILEIDRQFYVTSDHVAHWSLFVTYLPSQQPDRELEQREKVDYKNVLSPDDFEKFMRLRSLRRALAVEDAVPAYAVFTDKELSQIAQLPSVELSLLKQISGIGEKRLEKYGKLLCEKYNSEL